MLTVTGILELDGQALEDQRVLLISGDMTRFLASTTTSRNGEFQLAVPSEDGEVVLLVKIQAPVVGIVNRVINLERDGPGPHEFRLGGKDFQNIDASIVTTSGWPPFLSVFVDPVHVEGIPEPLEKFFFWQDERVVESAFFKMRVEGKSFNVRVMNGVYRIGASYLNRFRSRMVNPEFENYTAIKAEAGGQSLAGESHSGYQFEVMRDRQVALTIEVVPTEKLIGP